MSLLAKVQSPEISEHLKSLFSQSDVVVLNIICEAKLFICSFDKYINRHLTCICQGLYFCITVS